MLRLLRNSLLVISVWTASIGVARADAVADFFRGRTVSIGVVAAGGLYALNAQLLARHMARHIPGTPNIIMTVRSGAGGLNNLNYLANAAPRDGTAMALVHKDLAFFQLIGAKGVKYDAKSLNWIGSVHPMHTAMLLWHGAPAKTLAEAKSKEVVMGASGANHPSSMFPVFVNRQLGTKFKVVPGYRGAADIFVAFERGEVQGTSIAWDIVRSSKSAWIRDRQVVPIVQLSVEKAADLPNVPLLTEIMPGDEARRMARILVAGSKVGMALAVPPAVPEPRVAALREAFDSTMADPDYVKEATSRRLMVDATSGVQLKEFIDDVMRDNSPALLEELKRAIAP